MTALFMHSLKCIMRNSGLLVWTLAFPVILSTCFVFMFSGIDEFHSIKSVRVAVVEDTCYLDDSPESTTFREFVESASEDGSSGEEGVPLIEPVFVGSLAEGQNAADSQEVTACLSLDGEGEPVLSIPQWSDSRSEIDRSILQEMVRAYMQAVSEAEILTEATLSGGVVVDLSRMTDAFDASAVPAEESDVLRVDPDGYSRFYYAVLGMAAIMGSCISLTMISQTRANLTPVGVRRQVSATSPIMQLAVTIAASWLALFVCLVIAYAYTRFILGVEYGGRDALAIVSLAMCALVGTGLGALIGAIPKLSLGAKNGICTCAACLLSLTAGLYGEPAMQLADWITVNYPIAQLVNPAAQVTQSFYDLTFYDTLAPFASTLGVLAVMAVVMFAVSALLMRRQRHAGL